MTETNYNGGERRSDSYGIRADISTIKTDVRELKEDFKTMNISIHGNSDAGLKTKVDRNTSFRKAVTWTIGVVIGSGGATGIVIVIIKLINGG